MSNAPYCPLLDRIDCFRGWDTWYPVVITPGPEHIPSRVSSCFGPFVIELALMSLIAPRSFRLYLKILILCFCSSPALSSAKFDRNAVNGTRHQSAYDLANGTQHGFVYDLGAVTQQPELESTSDFFDTSDVAPSSSSMLRKGMCIWCVWRLQRRACWARHAILL